MKQHRWFRLLAVLSVLALVVAACGDDDDEDEGAGDTTTTEADEPAPEGDGVLKIGYLLPETGALDFLGPAMIQAVQMAADEINAAGGILGQDVELVAADDGTDADIASAATDGLIADGVDVIVGAAASGVSLAVIDKITDTPIVQCSPSNTGLQFTTYDDGGYYFRTAPPDNLQAQVLSDLITGDGGQVVQIIARSDEYGEGFANALAEELNAAGAEAADPILYDPEATSFTAEAEALAAANADSIALIAFEEGGSVIQAAIAAGVGPDTVQWYGTDGIQSSSFYEAVDPNNPAVVSGIRGTAPSAAPADGEATFRERFEAFAPGVDTIFSGHAYDCVIVAALAAAAAGSDAAEAIQAEMNGVTGGGEQCLLVADCLELIEAGEDIDYDGAAGPLDFVDAGEPGAGAYDTWEFVDDGSVSVIEESIPVGG
ncbi:MAG TPA: ABC transporter substrate-binding protein [Acidimicrobiia bacterium]|nr:ABC transporter substrate-binding protein [Acidimicrobiia bacterium]